MKNFVPTSFDKTRLAEVWREGCGRDNRFPRRDEERWANDTLYCDEFVYDATGHRRDDATRQDCLTDFYIQLLHHQNDPSTHFDFLDSKFSEILICRFQASELDPAMSSCESAAKATHLLSRLPAIPSQIDLTYHVWGDPSTLVPLSEYMDKTASVNKSSINPRSAWAELQVVSHLSTAILKLALLVTTTGIGRLSLGLSIRSFVNLVSELLDLGPPKKASDDKINILGNTIVRSFLWTTWQRSLMILMWFVLKTHLELGYDKEWDALLALRGCSELMNPSVRSTLYGWNDQSHPYMCKWAFSQLRSSRASMGLDFRRFHQRFSALHHKKSGRCQFQSDRPCCGDHPMNCGRFKNEKLVQPEQSLHDEACNERCEKVVWDETSYANVDGPKAASLDSISGNITYTRADETTLAISHVWSHGQGSRPHIGINKCLHERYKRIAKKRGCTSYWFDSICIPAPHNLRKEAIGYINCIFADSKITLVCDKDLMAIDVSNPTNELLESLFATFLVCDWTVRAWTLLEAMKGSHAIHLLCKSDIIISLRDLLIKIHQEGSLDIGILCLSAQHLIPSSTNAFRRPSSRQSVEVAGSLLSHRHATRLKDDIVIWSLLSSTKVFEDAKQMWVSKINQRISTAYLVSNAPRLEGVRGFSWAPNTPYIRKPDHGSGQDLLGPYNPFEGSDSELGLITDRGLYAEWMVYRFTDDDSPIYKDAQATMTSISSNGERIQTILPNTIKNHCWELVKSFYEKYEYVNLIQPLKSGRSRSYDAAMNRGESHGQVFAICTSRNLEKWSWQGVQAWPSGVPMPHLVSEPLLIE